MTTTEELLKELKQEGAVTRRYLERVPFDRVEFQPNEKAEKLGRLAVHVAEIIAWWNECISHDQLDFIDFEPKDIKSSVELLRYFDDLLLEAVRALSTSKDSDLEKEWSMRHGKEIYFTLPKRQVLRIFCMNHLVHHRAQLGVYLRLLNIAVPATYGPSSDDEDVLLVNRF